MPADWQNEIQAQIARDGLAATLANNQAWLASNPNDTGSSALAQWIAANGDMAAQTAPTAGLFGQINNVVNPSTINPNTPVTGWDQLPPSNMGPFAPSTSTGNTGTGNWWGAAAMPTYQQLVAKWQAENRGPLESAAQQQAFNAWAGTVAPAGWSDYKGPPDGMGSTTGTGASTNTSTGTIIRDANGNPIRDLAAEGVATQEAALRLAPGWAEAYKTFAPQYAQTDVNVMGQSLFGPGFTGNLSDINKRLTEEAIAQTNTGNRAARQAGIADINEFGGQINQARMDLNPALWKNLDQLDASARAGVVQASPYQKAMGNMFTQGFNTQPVGADVLKPTSITQDQILSSGDVGVMNNPWLTNAANNAAGRGQSALGMDLTGMARQQIALGSGLSEEQKRNAVQAAREGWGARGLINSTGAVAGEILNRDAYGQQLLNQRQGFASGVEQLGQSQQGINDAYINNILSQLGQRTGQDLTAQQTNVGNRLQEAQLNQANAFNTQAANQQNIFNTGQANQAANLNAGQFNAGLQQSDRAQLFGMGQTLAGLDSTQQQQNFNNLMSQTQLRAQNQNDPMAILGIGTANQGTNAALGGMGGTASSGGYGNQQVYQQFNPFSSYGSDVFNTNFNAGESRYLNAQNNAANLAAAQAAGSATKSAGAMSGVGSLLGGIFGGPVGAAAGGFVGGLFKCWVAREVYGAENPKWLQFRAWLEQRAPRWLHDLYVKHGEKFAAWLHRNPWAKPPIRAFMDSRIRSLLQSEEFTHAV